MGRCAIVGSNDGSGFAQTVRGAMRQTRFVAPRPELRAKAFGAERFPILGHQKGEIARWTFVDDALENRQHRKCELHRIAVADLALCEAQEAITHVLAAKENDIGFALTGKEKQHER